MASLTYWTHTVFILSILYLRCCVSTNITETPLDTKKCPEDCVCTTLDATCTDKQLTKIPDGFDGDVQMLIVTSNQITIIEEDAFKNRNLYELQTLLINHNKLKEIHPNAFSNLKQLRVLDLGDNDLTHIDANMFASNPHLLILRLDHNPKLVLPDEGPLVVSLALRELKLSNSNITNLPIQIFSGTPGLDAIDLKENNITNLNPEVFQNLTSLIKLTLPKTITTKHQDICQTVKSIQYFIIAKDEGEERIECNTYRKTNETDKNVTIDDIPTTEAIEYETTVEIEIENSTVAEKPIGNITTEEDIKKNQTIADKVEIEVKKDVELNHTDTNLTDAIADNKTKELDSIDTNVTNETIEELSQDAANISRVQIQTKTDSNENVNVTDTDKEIPSTKNSSELTKSNIDNIILGIIITALVVGAAAIFVKQRRDNKKKQASQQREPESMPLKTMEPKENV